jgi:tetratricopeptide (TPR) repeat protein
MFYKRRKVDYLVAKVNVNVESKEIVKDLNKKEEYLCSLLEEKDYESIIAEFDDFCNLQLRRDVKKYNIFLPISKRNLKTLLLCFIEKGQYFDGNRYLKIYKNQGETLDDELIEIENLINICRELSIARYDKKDVELVQKLIEKYEESYPDLLDIYRAKIWIMENKAKTEEDYKEIDELCNSVLKTYFFDGEIMAIQAKAKLECGQKEEAMKLYKKSVDNTRNGIIWQKVEDECGYSRMNVERELIKELNGEE